MPGSYAPDMDPVSYEPDGALGGRFRARSDAAGMRKELRVRLHSSAARVEVTHVVTNRAHWPVRIAPWAITITAANGTAVMPQPVYRAHHDDLLPARRLVQWSYTDLSDPRWRLGRRLIALTPDPLRTEPQKSRCVE